MLIYLQVIETEEDKTSLKTYTRNIVALCIMSLTSACIMNKTQRTQYIMHL